MSKFGKNLSATGQLLVTLGRRALFRRSLIAVAAVTAGTLTMPAPRARAADAQAPIDPMGGDFRRVVIGNNARGKSYVFKDERIKRGEIWHSNPQEPLGAGGPGDPNTALPAVPPPSPDQPTAGTRWQYTTLRPSADPIDRATIKGWHRVSSLTYVFIANGEVTLLLDEGDVVLRGGDFLVMRNAMHTWHNATATPVGLLMSQNLLS